MTLIIGIRCQDGIILGSDSMATTGSLSLPEVEGKTVTFATSKLEVYGERVVLGVAGAVGMGQSFHREIDQFITDRGLTKATWKNITEARAWLRDHFWPYVMPGWEHARELGGKLVPEFRQGVFSAVATSSLVSFPIGEELYLLELDHLCEPTECTEKNPFVTTGSGKMHADPFLSFIRRVFWSSNLPTLEDGMFAAIWTLEHAISLSPGGVGGPIQLVTLTNPKGKGWKASKLTPDEWGEHSVAIKALEEEMPQVVANFFSQRDTPPIPNI